MQRAKLHFFSENEESEKSVSLQPEIKLEKIFFMDFTSVLIAILTLTAGIAFQTEKMVPFIGDQSNEAYNNRITTITANGTYYACAEGYKNHNTGYDNTNYSSDRYAAAKPFTVNVSIDIRRIL